MTRDQIYLASYFVGWLAAFYLGVRYELWRRRKQRREDALRAYDRGFAAGKSFLNRIDETRLDVESAVRIIQGEDDAHDDDSWRSFADKYRLND